jgi:DNA-binding Lrp family transcriptional regulator
MKPKHVKIIQHLRQDSRMSLTDLSKKTKVPISTLFEWLKANNGALIVRNTALLEFEALGYHTKVNVALKCSPQHLQELMVHLKSSPNVNNLYKVTPEFNLIFEGIFKQIRHFDDFMTELEARFQIMDKRIFYIVKDIERERFMADPLIGEIVV